MSEARRTTQAFNVSIPMHMLESVQAWVINSSAGPEDRGRRHRRDEWLAQNAGDIEACNREVREHRSFDETLRGP